MENEQRKCVVEYRPAEPGMYLSEMAKYHLSSMVPCGRLTRDKDIRTALAKLFGVSWVSFERDYAQMMQVLWDDTVMRSWNRHRIVSDGGNVYIVYAVKDYGNLQNAEIYKVSTRETEWGTLIDLSEEKQTVSIYKAKMRFCYKQSNEQSGANRKYMP